MVDVGYPQDKQTRTEKERTLIALSCVQGRISLANLQQFILPVEIATCR